MKIGEFLQAHMNKQNISQAELARRTGIPASTISSIIIRNNDRVAIEMILKICEVLDCDIEEYINSLRNELPKLMPASFTRKYYSLDDYGKYAVDSILGIEYSRCLNQSTENKKITTKIAAFGGDNKEIKVSEDSLIKAVSLLEDDEK